MRSLWSAVAPRLLGFGLIGFVLYWFFLADDSRTRNVVVINQELGVISEVTGYNKARDNKIYLNSSDVPYNFDHFENQELAQFNGLGYYLEQGDSVYKRPNATLLLLVRQGRRSSWRFVPPDTTAP